jgi:hypothetical protein
VVATLPHRYLPVMGQPPKPWHNQLYKLAVDIQGTQAPQTAVEWGPNQLQTCTKTMKVLKLTKLLALLALLALFGLRDAYLTLDAVPDTMDATSLYDEVITRFGMYMPAQFLPVLLERHLTPKKHFFT